MKAAAASSAESEYMAMALATREAIWLTSLYRSMGYGDLKATTFGDLCGDDYKKVRLSKTVDPYEMAMMIQGDNKASLAIARNPVLHKRSKHIDLAFHITRQATQANIIAPTYISTNDNTSDLMTKSLGTTLHNRHSEKLLSTMKDGKLFHLNGDAFVMPPPREVRLKLYDKEPAELNMPSECFERIVKMFTSNFEVPTIAYDLSETLGKWAEQQRDELPSERKRVTKKRVTVTFEPSSMETRVAGMAITAEQKLRSCCDLHWYAVPLASHRRGWLRLLGCPAWDTRLPSGQESRI